MEFVVATISEDKDGAKSWVGILSMTFSNNDQAQEPITAHAILDYAAKFDAVFQSGLEAALSFHGGAYITNGWIWMERVDSSDLSDIRTNLFFEWEQPDIYRVIQESFIPENMRLTADQYFQRGHTK